MLEELCPGQTEITGEGECLKSSLRAIRSSKPDVVFLDIHLFGCTGFDVLSALEPEERDFALIVVTHWEQYAIDAIAHSVVAFLTKPIDPDELTGAINKAKIYREDSAYLRARKTSAFLRYAEARHTEEPLLQLYYSLDMHEVPISQIIYCFVEGNYTTFMLCSDSDPAIRVKEPLKNYRELLLKNEFFATDKSTLVNMKHIEKLKHGEGDRKCCAFLKKGYRVEMSNDKYNEILKIKKKGVGKFTITRKGEFCHLDLVRRNTGASWLLTEEKNCGRLCSKRVATSKNFR